MSLLPNTSTFDMWRQQLKEQNTFAKISDRHKCKLPQWIAQYKKEFTIRDSKTSRPVLVHTCYALDPS